MEEMVWYTVTKIDVLLDGRYCIFRKPVGPIVSQYIVQPRHGLVARYKWWWKTVWQKKK